MTTLDHRAAAELLFASGQDAATPRAAVRAIVRQYRLHPDLAESVAEMAREYGEHPTEAAARMARCLALVPDRLELPDALTPGELALIGCESDDCTNPPPYLLIGKRLYCALCAASAVLAETAGGDDDDQ